MRLFCIFVVLLGQICHVSAVMKTSGVTQDSGIITAEAGDNVTLRCSCLENDVTFLSWYQQSLGGKPLLIASRLLKSEASISSAFKERFQVLAQGPNCSNHLKIRNISVWDSATYYCAILEFNVLEFGQGVFLHVKTPHSSIHADIYQPPLETLQSGDSVDLSCTVHAEPCVEKQSLYWFRYSATQSAVMDATEEYCDEEPHACVSILTLMSVSSLDEGMYYCALASCGKIVFGSGTKVDIVGGSTEDSLLMVYYLSGALAVSIMVLLILAFTMYKLKKKSCSVCKGPVFHLACSAASDTVSQDADILHYAALSLNRTSERHRQEDNVESECVYSRVKSRE